MSEYQWPAAKGNGRDAAETSWTGGGSRGGEADGDESCPDLHKGDKGLTERVSALQENQTKEHVRTWKTRMCKQYMLGWCSKQDCAFAHHAGEITCRYYQLGCCSRADCKFSHQMGEIEHSTPKDFPRSQPKKGLRGEGASLDWSQREDVNRCNVDAMAKSRRAAGQAERSC